MSRTRLTAWLRLGALLLAPAGVLSLSACGGGSGAPNNPFEPGPTTPTPLVVVPAEAIAFAGTPLILSITGGTPPYQAFSSNPSALPVPQNVNGNTLALLANNVDAGAGRERNDPRQRGPDRARGNHRPPGTAVARVRSRSSPTRRPAMGVTFARVRPALRRCA